MYYIALWFTKNLLTRDIIAYYESLDETGFSVSVFNETIFMWWVMVWSHQDLRYQIKLRIKSSCLNYCMAQKYVLFIIKWIRVGRLNDGKSLPITTSLASRVGESNRFVFLAWLRVVTSHLYLPDVASLTFLSTTLFILDWFIFKAITIELTILNQVKQFKILVR